MPSTLSRRAVVGALACTPAVAGRARAEVPHRLEVGQPLARFDWLKPGVRTYLRSHEKDGRHTAIDIWRRETRFETIDGQPRLRIVQRWDGADAPVSLVERDSLFEVGTFRPLTHVRISSREDRRMVEGFRFSLDRISGLEGLSDNRQAELNLPFAEPMYNFETDMEMLQTLPLAEGYAVSIPFHHPGSQTAARYLWRVTGAEALTTPDGRPMDCWVVETDYNTDKTPPARFWLAQATQVLVRMESRTAEGALQRKTLLA